MAYFTKHDLHPSEKDNAELIVTKANQADLIAGLPNCKFVWSCHQLGAWHVVAGPGSRASGASARERECALPAPRDRGRVAGRGCGG
jgi:hypothetical protein